VCQSPRDFRGEKPVTMTQKNCAHRLGSLVKVLTAGPFERVIFAAQGLSCNSGCEPAASRTQSDDGSSDANVICTHLGMQFIGIRPRSKFDCKIRERTFGPQPQFLLKKKSRARLRRRPDNALIWRAKTISNALWRCGS
jgi:hypothetical protein